MSWVPELSQAPESSKIEGAQLSQMLRFCRFSGSKNGHGADWFLACLIDPRLINEALIETGVSCFLEAVRGRPLAGYVFALLTFAQQPVLGVEAG